MLRQLTYQRPGGRIEPPRGPALSDTLVDAAIGATNQMFEKLHEASPHVSNLLGMRNLSAFVGAAFAAELEAVSGGLLILNPHQDGYPDLLLMDDIGASAWDELRDRLREKAPFSPFPSGGLEIKATCGDVPSAASFSARGLEKPSIGDTRVDLIATLNWKSHHRETNNLVGIIWDFVDHIPALAAITYRGDLVVDDWGTIVAPKAGGGRTTSVSAMNRAGVVKMCSNVVRVLDGPYLDLTKRLTRPPRGGRV